jgi:two-component system NtrC family sensor kinase
VAAGDLATVIPVTASHELGDLARAFNSMTQSLADARRQVTQADKLASVGRLAAGVAHEINNPLTGVLTYASFLAKRAETDPETRQDLEVIVRETKRCREIVRGLLDFARQAPPLRRPTDLNVVVRRTLAVLQNQLSLKRVSAVLDLAEDLPQVAADQNQLQQVVLNLVLNAADATGESGGTIRVTTRGEESSVELAVEDEGCGIRREHLPHLFEPFFSTKGTGGTGLGLAVIWGIVQGHGGTIDVKSEEGKGARFTVRLPHEPAPALAEVAS